MVRLGRRRRHRGRAHRSGPASACRVAPARGRGVRGRHSSHSDRAHRRIVEPAHRSHRPAVGPDGLDRRAQLSGGRRVPGDRARVGARTDTRRTIPPRAVDGRSRGGGRSLPADARTARPLLEPARVRRAGGARHGAAHVRQQALARDPARRALVAGGGEPAQDARAELRRGVDGFGRHSRTHRLGA